MAHMPQFPVPTFFLWFFLKKFAHLCYSRLVQSKDPGFCLKEFRWCPTVQKLFESCWAAVNILILYVRKGHSANLSALPNFTQEQLEPGLGHTGWSDAEDHAYSIYYAISQIYLKGKL